MEKNISQENSQEIAKVFLVGLNPKFKLPELLEYLKSQYSSVTSCTSKSSNKSGKIKTSIATVSLSSQKEASELLKKGFFVFRERKVHCKPYLTGFELQKFKNNVKRRRAFLHNISLRVDNQMLKRALEIYGEIEDAFVIKKESRGKVKKNIGYVIFKDVTDTLNFCKLGKIKTNFGVIKVKPYEGGESNQGSEEGSKKVLERKYRGYTGVFDGVKETRIKKVADTDRRVFENFKEVLKTDYFRQKQKHFGGNVRLNWSW